MEADFETQGDRFRFGPAPPSSEEFNDASAFIIAFETV